MSAPEFPDALVARAAEALVEHWAAGMAPNGEAHQWECVCGQPLEMSDEAHQSHTARAVLLALGPELQAAALREAALAVITECAHFGSYVGRAHDFCGYCETAAWLLRARADHLAPAPANEGSE